MSRAAHTATRFLPTTSRQLQTRGNALNITEREHDVIHYLSKGLTNKEIARKLGISQHTVRDHLSSVFRKLNVSSRIELAILIETSKLDAHNA
ncbi:response regulator transcription factor [Pseudomonas wayambapalatensis]|uniref:response regulator transcription factor n=1 Tax=Pseudomonas wayambapalatensis TaxID=485895 RepID=UPI003CE88FA0